MKADAPPIAAPPELNIPPWVPEPIAQFARASYAADVHRTYAAAIREIDKCGRDEAHALAEQDEVRAAYADIVREDLADIAERYWSLVCDQRMHNVWRELSRQRQRDRTFLHPARMPLSVANATERQGAAMLELLKTALECWDAHGAATTTQHRAEQQRKHYLAKAGELERDALTMMRQHAKNVGAVYGEDTLTDRQRSEIQQKLRDAAETYKEHAHRLQCAQIFMPERGGDDRGRWVALTIGSKFRALFGSPMYGLTATITSVVLGRQIKTSSARTCCAPHPAVKPQKIAP